MAGQRKGEAGGQDESEETETEGEIEVIATTPAAPHPNRTAITAHFNGHIVETMARTLSAKAGERLATMAAAPSQPGKATATANTHIKMLTDIIASVLKAMEEQREEQKRDHAKHCMDEGAEAGTSQTDGGNGATETGAGESNRHSDENIYPRGGSTQGRRQGTERKG